MRCILISRELAGVNYLGTRLAVSIPHVRRLWRTSGVPVRPYYRTVAIGYMPVGAYATLELTSTEGDAHTEVLYCVEWLQFNSSSPVK